MENDLIFDKVDAENTENMISLAMAYVPWQKNDFMYDNLEKAFMFGTVFPALHKPFLGRRCVHET